MATAVVLVAAGQGVRLGAGIPKAEVKVSGRTLLEHALSNIKKFDPEQLVIVAPAGKIKNYKELAAAFGFQKLDVLEGGATRQLSVAAGLARVHQDAVLIHDAARAFTPKAIFDTVSKALETRECVVPALLIADTVKEVKEGKVQATLDRSKLRAIQTPQGFSTAVLRKAIASASQTFTDEAGLLESQGVEVSVVEGSSLGFKVTTQADLDLARSIFGSTRSGIGTDAHQFSGSGTLMLGCLPWTSMPVLEGHSDGDSVAHAIVDALLSAAALGDIGSRFGVDRKEYAGAAGEVFIKGALELVAEAGFRVLNVSVQIVADAPKIGPRRAELQEKLSSIVGAPVTVSATTTDGLGFLADSAGIAAVATALLAEGN